MKIFAIGLGGFGSSMVGGLLDEVKATRGEGQELNFDYTIIDFLGEIERLPWRPEQEKYISLVVPSKEWIEEKFEFFQKEDIVDFGAGAGRGRCYAKTTFEWNKRRIEAAIEAAFYHLLSRFFHEEGENIDCWIFTSFDGGTGSGIVIDLAILLDRIGEHFEPMGHNLSIYLVGIIPAGSLREQLSSVQPLNTIQTFKEMDYIVSGKSEEEYGIKNPFDQIFLMGMESLAGPKQRVDKLVAKSIAEFCYGITDFNMMNEIANSGAGLENKKFLSFSIAHYRFPMDEIIEMYECENEIDKREKERARIKEEIKKFEKEIEEKAKDMRGEIELLEEKIDELHNRIAEIERYPPLTRPIRYGMLYRARIHAWENEIEKNERKIEEMREGLEMLLMQRRREIEKREKQVYELEEEIYKLRGKTEELKSELEREEMGYLLKDSIHSEGYERIKKDIQELRERSLREIADYLKEEGIKRYGFDDILGARMDYLIREQSQFINWEGSIPFIELGYKAPVGCIRGSDLHFPPMVEAMEVREIPRETRYEINLYAILGGIEPRMIYDLREFKIDYLNYQESNPNQINQSLAAFLLGKKKWSEYMPDWLKED